MELFSLITNLVAELARSVPALLAVGLHFCGLTYTTTNCFGG